MTGNQARRPYEQQQLETWFLSNKEYRHIAWQDLPLLVPLPLCKYGSYALSNAMRDLRYEIRTRPRNIYLTDAHKQARRQFARGQLNLRPDPRHLEGVIFSNDT